MYYVAQVTTTIFNASSLPFKHHLTFRKRKMQCPPSSPPREVTAAAAAAAAAKLLPGFSPSPDGLGAGTLDAKGKTQPFKIYHDPEVPSMNGFYPTPLPTSQADASSPTRSPRGVETGRVALSQLAFVKLPLDGTTVTVGRSSKSSKIALTATNKLVSRVHAKIHYDPARLVVIECLGWNGLTVYVPCIIKNERVQKEYKVVKDQTIYIERVDGISLNIHGERVIIEIEQPDLMMHSSEATEDEYPEISGLPSSPLSRSGDELAIRIAQELGAGAQLAEPIALHSNTTGPLPVTVVKPAQPEAAVEVPAEPTVVAEVVPKPPVAEVTKALETELSKEPVKPLATVAEAVEAAAEVQHTAKPKKHRYSEDLPEAKKAKSAVDHEEASKLAINHVAFSRLASTPLSTIAGSSSILASLPSLKLEGLLANVPYIGVIQRTGKDALGKPLENEYYYMPEHDDDLTRRQLVAESKGARTLRSCRKTHKQYFYKKPRI